MTAEIALVLFVLAATIVLFVTEAFRVDVIAIMIMLTLPWLGLVEPAQAFSGLASNAVVSIIAIMILGYGLERSGIMNRIVRPIMSVAGSSEKRLIGFVSSIVGALSAFLQNIGAAALFLPAMMRIAKNSTIPISRLLMPLGFAAILGGTLSMVGSGPLIILNDLLKQAGQQRFGLFAVTPVGLALVAAGILYFLTLGKYVLPERKKENRRVSPQQELIETWKLSSTIHRYVIPQASPLIGRTREEIRLWTDYHINLLAIAEKRDILYAPWRHTRFAEGQHLALLGTQDDIARFAADYHLRSAETIDQFQDLRNTEISGFAEVIIPPRAPIAGKTLRGIALRKTYVVEPILLLSGVREERGDFSDQTLQAGDGLIIHGPWENIKALADNRNFVLVTPVEGGAAGKARPVTALLCFLGAISLAMTGFQLSLGLLSGALAMILLRVVSIDEAYKAVDWRTVFLLAGLIPLGIAMETTGAARYIAGQMMGLLQGSHAVVILAAVALLSTVFSLFMSNVAATVLLVPLVMIMGQSAGINPRALALLVAVCASNSFILPTHQVNALLMSPGGYHNADYLKAGSLMTLIFLVIAVGFMYLFYL
jgi:di/tricarboxylate transporter